LGLAVVPDEGLDHLAAGLADTDEYELHDNVV
jgi:hypothetical protein